MLFEQLTRFVGAQGAQAIQTALAASAPHNQGKLASAVAVVVLVLSATGLFMELQGALNTIWGVEAKPGQGIWGFIKNRLVSFAMVIGIGLLLLVTLAISAALASAAKYFSALVPGLGEVTLILNGLLAFLLITVLFAMIFKVLPDVMIGWRDVWIGAAVTALLFTAGKFLLGLYLGRNTTVSAYGAAGSLVLILLWVYYSAQILFFGAELTRAYAHHFGDPFEPKPNARWRQPQEIFQKPTPLGHVAQHPHDRKAALVSEIRDEVNALRAARDHIRTTARSRKSRFIPGHKPSHSRQKEV
jgi:membrane protein